MKAPRIILWDVENSPATGFFYEMYKEGNIIEIINHSFMLSFSYKVLGESKIHCYALPDFKGYRRNKSDDRLLVTKLAEVLASADIAIAHNGARHDITLTNTRLVANGLAPIPPIKTIDTLQLARRQFKFLSNRLDELAKFFGIGRKLPHTGFHLWKGCMDGDEKSWRLMKKYNAHDVFLLEGVYLKLRPWHTTHPNVNLESRVDGCPKCGSKRLVREGTRYTMTGAYQRYSCLDCLAWCKGKPEKLERALTIK